MIQSVLIAIVFSAVVALYVSHLALLYFFARRKKRLLSFTILALVIAPVGLLGVNIGAAQHFVWAWIASGLIPALLVYAGGRWNWSVYRIFAACHLPIVLFGILYSTVPAWTAAAAEYWSSLALTLQNGEAPAEIMQQIEAFVAGSRFLFPAVLIYEVSFRLVLAGVILARIQHQYPDAQMGLPRMAAVRYVDWPVWIVIGSLLTWLLGLFGGNDSLVWASISMLWVLVPFYALRGYSVTTFRLSQRFQKEFSFAGLPIWIQMVFIVTLLFFAFYFILFLACLGLLDTWFEFRQKKNELEQERTTVWK